MDLEELETAFRRAVKGEEPYPHQRELGRLLLSEWEPNVILSAGTGSGKTEAALVPALLTRKRIFLLYPTKALLQDQYERVKEVSEKVLGYRPRIVVDTGDEDDPTGYSADIVLTNLDKFVYRMFGYGRRRWGFTYPFRLVHDRRKPLLIFDEAHAYEETIFSHFWFVLNKLTYEQRVQTVLLSATLPEEFVEVLRDRGAEDTRAFPRPDDEDFFRLIKDEERRTGRQFYGGAVSTGEALSRAVELFPKGRRVAVVFRMIRGKGGLQEAWEMVQEKVGGQMLRIEDGHVIGSVLAYHGAQLPEHRARVLEQLQRLDEDKEPYLLLATHAMEVGVNISAEVMFCGVGRGDFALGPDSFVQQIGRCARRKDEHGEGERGEVYLMVGEEQGLPRFADELEEGAEISPDVKARINAMNQPPSVRKAEGSIEYLHDEALYRYVYDYVPENEELWERGTLVTRSWEPTVELVLSDERGDEPRIGGIEAWKFWKGEKVTQSLSLPIKQAVRLAPRCAWVFTGQDEANDTPVRLALGGDKQRKLGEALWRLGYPVSTDQSKYTFRDARRASLMLLMPEAVREELFADGNLGLIVPVKVQEDEVKPLPSGNDHIARYEVMLKKGTPSTSLTLQWEQPREEED